MGLGHFSGDSGSWATHLSAKVQVPAGASKVWVTPFPGQGRAVTQEAVAEGSVSCAFPEGTQTQVSLPAATQPGSGTSPMQGFLWCLSHLRTKLPLS